MSLKRPVRSMPRQAARRISASSPGDNISFVDRRSASSDGLADRHRFTHHDPRVFCKSGIMKSPVSGLPEFLMASA